jgi:dipeptidyl aminopeptidase/acylaminoacyl peptidase
MNFRGSSGYGKAFAEAGYREWGGLMQDDISDTVKYFHDRGLASADKTCIVGYSYGGYAALYGGASTPELYKCVVSGGGVSDLKLSLKNTKRDYGKDSETYEYWLKSQGDPQIDAQMLAQKSPVNMAEDFQAPVLLIHGERDGNVHVEQSESMEEVLKEAGKAVTFIELEDEGHSGWSLENEMIYYESIEAFLQEHIGR